MSLNALLQDTAKTSPEHIRASVEAQLNFLDDIEIARWGLLGFSFEPYKIDSAIYNATILEELHTIFALAVNQSAAIQAALRNIDPIKAEEFITNYNGIYQTFQNEIDGHWGYNLGQFIDDAAGFSFAFFGNAFDFAAARLETLGGALSTLSNAVVLGHKVAVFAWDTTNIAIDRMDDFLWSATDSIQKFIADPSTARDIPEAIVAGMRSIFATMSISQRAELNAAAGNLVNIIENAGKPVDQIAALINGTNVVIANGYSPAQALGMMFNVEVDFWLDKEETSYGPSKIISLLQAVYKAAEIADEIGRLDAYLDGNWPGKDTGGRYIAEISRAEKRNDLIDHLQETIFSLIPTSNGTFGVISDAIISALDVFFDSRGVSLKSDLGTRIGQLNNNFDAYVSAFNSYTHLLDGALSTLGSDWGRDQKVQFTLADDDRTFYGSKYDESIHGTSLDDIVYAGIGSDILYGSAGIDDLRGEAGEDSLYGGDNNDILYGGGGSDYLKGEAGNDYLLGEAGIDELYGDAGSDTLDGGEDFDKLYGGPGSDIFVLNLSAVNDARMGITDIIVDFNRGDSATYSTAEGDVIDLSEVMGELNPGTTTTYLNLVRVEQDISGTFSTLSVFDESEGIWLPVIRTEGVQSGHSIALIVDPLNTESPSTDNVTILEGASSPQNVIYSHDFSVNPGWTTDQAENYYWNSSTESFIAKSSNFIPDYLPNRYAFVEIDLDVSKSFSVRWDQRILAREGYGTSHFGLFAEDLTASKVTWTGLPHIVPLSTFNAQVGGFQSDPSIYAFNIVTEGGMSEGQEGSGEIKEAALNTWFTNILNYDADSSTVTWEVTYRETGELVRQEISRVISGEFLQDMTKLGTANHPIGYQPGQPWSLDPTDYQITEYDNIQVTGETLNVEAITIPLPFNSNGQSVAVTQVPGIGSSHTGALYTSWDFALPFGSPVLSVASGEVIDIRESVPDGGNYAMPDQDGDDNPLNDSSSLGSGAIGNLITILHNVDGQSFYATYMHLMQNSVPLSIGQTVQAGQLLGLVGNTGARTGTHLHFQVGSEAVPFGYTNYGGGVEDNAAPQSIANALQAQVGLVSFDTYGADLPAAVVGGEGELVAHPSWFESGETIRRISVGQVSQLANLSADGRYVSFQSQNANGNYNVFVYDMLTRDTLRVTQGNGSSDYPSLSSDGRYVAFDSAASNLMDGDNNGVRDVFVHDTVTGRTRRVSIASDGSEGNGSSDKSTLSADGRYVAFESDAKNLVAGDTNSRSDIFIHDTVTGDIRRVSVASDGGQSNSHSFLPRISADGRYVTFQSYANNLVSGDTNNFADIFVHDTLTVETRRVSVAGDGSQGNGAVGFVSLSANGRYVAFDSAASNLVEGDTNSVRDVFVHDRLTGEVSRVSVASNGSQGNENSYQPSLSADGRYVTYLSDASNLDAGDTNSDSDVFIHDRLTGETRRLSIASDGSQMYLNNAPSLSADGRFVAFTSGAFGGLSIHVATTGFGVGSTDPVPQIDTALWGTGTTHTIAVNNSAQGHIDQVGINGLNPQIDKDWYRVTLQGGTSYNFTGLSSLSTDDTLDAIALRLYWDNTTSVSPIVEGSTPSFVFTAPGSGPVDYYLAVSAGGEGDWTSKTGSYQLTVVEVGTASLPNQTPIANAHNQIAVVGTEIPLASLFTYRDPDGISDITHFAIQDRTPSGGYLVFNGQVQPANKVFERPIGEIGQWHFVVGDGADQLGFNAIDASGAFNSSVIASVKPLAEQVPLLGVDDLFDAAGGKILTLATFALAAYAREETALKDLKDLGWKVLKHSSLSSSSDDYYVNEGASAILAETPHGDSLVISFTGTTGFYDDWFENISSDNPTIISQHYDLFESLLSQITFSDYENVYLTGHSLGAAMAQRLMLDTRYGLWANPKVETVTFANPGFFVSPLSWNQPRVVNFAIEGDAVANIGLAELGFGLAKRIVGDVYRFDHFLPSDLDWHSMSFYLAAARYLEETSYASTISTRQQDDVRDLYDIQARLEIRNGNEWVGHLGHRAVVTPDGTQFSVGAELDSPRNQWAVSIDTSSAGSTPTLIFDAPQYTNTSFEVTETPEGRLRVSDETGQELFLAWEIGKLVIRAGLAGLKVYLGPLSNTHILNNTVYFEGNDNEDVLDGSSADRRIVADGGLANDVLTGGLEGDSLSGGADNDTLEGGAGNDHLDGGAGTDTAVYSGARNDYELGQDNNTGAVTITDLRQNPQDGADTLLSIEYLQFSDELIATPRVSPIGSITVGGSDTFYLNSYNIVSIYLNVDNLEVVPETIELRIHYDSTQLNSVSFLSGLHHEGLEFDGVAQSDTQDFDNDPTTDTYLNVTWSGGGDISGGSNRINIFDLVTESASTLTGGEQVRLGFSSNTESSKLNIAAAGFDFEAIDESFDVDGNGEVDALSDGILLLRSIFGFTGQSLIAQAVQSNAVNRTEAEILDRTSELSPALDIDRNGLVDALTDGLLIIRYIFGFRGDTLTANAIGENSTRNTAALIEDYLDGFVRQDGLIMSALMESSQDSTNLVEVIGISNTSASPEMLM